MQTKSHSKSKVSKIKDYKNHSNIGITLWSDETLQALTKNSGPLTKANEYQVHYWSLNMRNTFPDGSTVDISIPTVLFNYAQEVSSAAIEFELTDVEEVSEAILPLHNIEVNKLMPQLEGLFPDAELISVNLNSVHKHPGGRKQSFSGTDLKKDHEEDTGIVFPLASGENKANFASIICISDGKTYLAHSEYRLANGDITDKGMEYHEGRCLSYISAKPSGVSNAEELFGYQPTTNSYIVTKHLGADNEYITNLIALWDTMQYTANTDFIKKENVVEKKYTRTSYQGAWDFSKGGYKKATTTICPSVNRTSPEHKEVIEYLALSFEIIIHTRTYLAKLDQVALIAYMEELEEYFYAGITVVSPNITITDIINLQDEILQEAYEFMAMEENPWEEALEINTPRDLTEEMVAELVMWGVPLKDIEAASEDMLVTWHERLTIGK